jgi:O-antigen/teichoic acid export membrane protein
LWSQLKGGFWSGKFSFSEFKKTGEKALRFSLVGVLGLLILNSDKALLSHFLTIQELGYYCFSWTLVMGVLNLSSILYMVFTPRFSHHLALKEEKELRANYHQACQWVAALIVPMTLVFLFFSKEILFVWTNDRALVEQSWAVASLLVIGACFNALSTPLQGLQMAMNWTSLTTTLYASTLILAVPSYIFASKSWGLIGAAAVWPSFQLIHLCISSYRMHQHFPTSEKRKWLINDLLYPALAACILCAVFSLAVPFAPQRPLAIIQLLFFGVLTIAISILACDRILLGVRAKARSLFTNNVGE